MRGLLLLGLLVLTVVTAGGCGDTVPVRSLVPVGEPRVQRQAGAVLVDGRVRNEHPSRAYSGQVTVTLFDEGGKTVGVFVGAINDVPPGEEATYVAVSGDAPQAWSRVEARVSALLPR